MTVGAHGRRQGGGDRRPPPIGRSRRWPMLVAGVVAVSVLAASCAGEPAPPAPSTGPTSGSAPTGSTGTAGAATTQAPLAQPIAPTGDPVVDEQLQGVARFVEEARGHPFRRPVTVQLLDDAAFEQRATQSVGEETALLRDQQLVLEALELLPPGTDLVAVEKATTREDLLGFYDPQSGELVVRGGTLTPFARVTVAHELTHALDDQWHDLGRRQEEAGDDADRRFGLTSLVEGSAQRVTKAYVDQLSSRDRRALEEEEERFSAGVDTSALPLQLVDIVQSPYELGEQLVEHLVANGGPAALEDAFADPPPSSESVLHPQRYDRREQPVDVPAPAADGPVRSEGVLGELTLFEMLSAKLAPAVAREAAEGWQGDRYVVWTSGARTCVRGDIRADTPTDLDQLESALRSWSFEHGDAAVARPDAETVRFTACT